MGNSLHGLPDRWFVTPSPPPVNDFDVSRDTLGRAMKDIRQEVQARVKATETAAQPTAPGI